MTRNIESFRTPASLHKRELNEGFEEYEEQRSKEFAERQKKESENLDAIIDSFYANGLRPQSKKEGQLSEMLKEFSPGFKVEIFSHWFEKNPEEALWMMDEFGSLPNYLQSRIALYIETSRSHADDAHFYERESWMFDHILKVFDLIIDPGLQHLLIKSDRAHFRMFAEHRDKLPYISDNDILRKCADESRVTGHGRTYYEWSNVVPFVDKFRSIDKKKLIELTLENNEHLEVLFEYREKLGISQRELIDLFYQKTKHSLCSVLKYIDPEYHQEIAETEILQSNGKAVLAHAQDFQQVNIASLLKKIEAQHSEEPDYAHRCMGVFLPYLDKLPDVWIQQIPQRAIDALVAGSPDKVSNVVDKFGDTVDKAQLTHKLFLRNHFGSLVNNSTKLGLRLDGATALEMIDHGMEKNLLQNGVLDKFERMPRDIYRRLVDRRLSEAYRTIGYFDGITKEDIYEALQGSADNLSHGVVEEIIDRCFSAHTITLDTELANFLIENSGMLILVSRLEKFQNLDHLDIAKKVIAKGDIDLVLRNIEKFTGLEGTYFVQQCVLDSKKVVLSARLPITDEMLDKHFAKSENKNLQEYKRLYNVFGCIEYYQNLLSRLEQDTSRQAKQQVIAILGVLGVRDMKNAEQYSTHKKKLLSFVHDKSALVRGTLAQSLAELAECGDAEVIQYLTSVIRERTKNAKDADEESRGVLGFNPTQEVALRTLFRLNNPTANESLFSLLFVGDLEPRMRQHILEHLIGQKKALSPNSIFKKFFFPNNIREWIQSKIEQVEKTSEDFPFEELKYFYATLKIPSTDIKTKSLDLCDKAFEQFSQREQLFVHDHTKDCPEVPDTIFLPLQQLTRGDKKLLSEFNEIYRQMKSSSKRDALQFGVVNFLSSDKHTEILDALIPKLEIFNISAPENIEHILTLFKTISFLLAVEKDFEVLDDRISESIISSGSLSELNTSLKEISIQKVKKILPNEGITSELIESLWEQWGNLEPLFTYAGKMVSGGHRDTLGFLAEMVVHMDPPAYEQWKAWRYDMESEGVTEQVGGLTENQLDIWKQDHFAELGDILIATTPSDKPTQIVGHLTGALGEKHMYNPEVHPSANHKFIQEQLAIVYKNIGESPDKKEAILNEAITRLQADVNTVDSLIRFGDVLRLEQCISMFSEGKDIPVNTKTKGNLTFLEQFLSKEVFEKVEEAYKTAEAHEVKTVKADSILGSELVQSLRDAVEEIKKSFQKALESDIFEKYGLNKDQLKNIGQFYKKRQELKALLDLYRLSGLDAKKIAMNRIDDSQGKKGETLKKVVDGLLVYFKDNLAFSQDLKNIQTLIVTEDTLDSKRRLAIITTDNPQMLLQSGKYPLGCGSCQNYEGDPDYNKSLAGYVGDAHTQVSFLIDLNKLPEDIRSEIDLKGFDEVKWSIPPQSLLEASIARSMNKLVQLKDNTPVLFLEPTYSSINKGDLSMDRYFNIFLELQIAEPMGIRLVRGEGKKKVSVPASRNPSGQYEDCAAGNAGHAGMGIKQGSYTMPARLVDKFSPVTDADRRLAERISV